MSGSLSLEHTEQQQIFKFKTKLKLLMDELTVEFNKCPDCGGTGLYDVHTFPVVNAYGEWIEDHSWGGLYCETCRGSGYINIDDCHIYEKCSWCKGKGCTGPYDIPCSKCVGTGYLLWIDNLIIGEKE